MALKAEGEGVTEHEESNQIDLLFYVWKRYTKDFRDLYRNMEKAFPSMSNETRLDLMLDVFMGGCMIVFRNVKEQECGIAQKAFAMWFENRGIKVHSPVGDPHRKQKIARAEKYLWQVFVSGLEMAHGLNPDTHTDWEVVSAADMPF